MAITIDGSANKLEIGANATGPSSLRLYEDTDNGTHYIDIIAPATVTSNRTLTLPDGTGTAVINGVNGSIISGTSKAFNWNGSSSNTSLDFTSIPSWAKRITVMFSGISTNGTSNLIIQLGDSGGFETTSYLGAGSFTGSSSGASNYTTGFGFPGANAANVGHGSVQINNINGNEWTAFGVIGLSSSAFTLHTGGTKTLSDTLTQVRITTVNGTDTFDAGTVNILYE